MDKSRNDQTKIKAFCNAYSVWVSLVKSYSLIALMNKSLITFYYNDSDG